jgi:hypothetical protein
VLEAEYGVALDLPPAPRSTTEINFVVAFSIPWRSDFGGVFFFFLFYNRRTTRKKGTKTG